MMRRLAERWRAADWYVEVAIAVVVGSLNAASAWVDDPHSAGQSGMWPATVALAAGLVLMGRRVVPLTVLACVMALLLVISLLDHQVGSTTVSLLFASHALGRWAPGRRGWAGMGATWLLFAGLAVTGDDYFSQPIAILAPMVYAVPFAVGRYAAHRAERFDAAYEEARTAERSLIARELHDIVSHALTGINVQASTSRHLGVDREQAHQTLGRIEGLSRSALGDLRRMLDLLREDLAAPAAPTPTIDDLPALVQEHVGTHGRATLTIEGSWQDVGPSMALAVYRLVQEALTNVARHANGAAATVRVVRADDHVLVLVDDEGSGLTVPARAGSHGITGMQERVATFGGTIETGPRPEGGYRVRALIPSSQ